MMKRITNYPHWIKPKKNKWRFKIVSDHPYSQEPQSDTASICLSQKVFAQLEAARMVAGHLEFSGFGFINNLTHNQTTLYEVYDVVILDVGSPGYTEIQSKDVLTLLDRPDANKMKLWFHRHPLGNSIPGPHNWSEMDNQTIEEEPLGGIPELVKWSVSIVRTPEAWVGRVDHYGPEGVQTSHIPVTVDVDSSLTEKVLFLRKKYESQHHRQFIPKSGLSDTGCVGYI